MFADNGAWIIEAQGLLTNTASGGGSVGVNRRFLADDSIIGGGFWYDVNESPNGNVFQQTVFSLELLQDDWSFRANGHLPVGPEVRNVANQSVLGPGGNVQFQNNNLLAGNTTTFRFDETAMRGIEIEIARSVGDWSGEVFVGYYNFQGKIGGSIDGIKGGVRGYVTPRIAGNITIADDPIFGTNVYGGFTWFLGGTGGNAPQTIEDKLTIPVERNHQVVINDSQTFINNLVILTDPGTNQPITVTHINDTGAGGTGTFEDPFGALPGTQLTDIAYVHSNTLFTNQDYALNPNQRFLGEGNNNNHLVDTNEIGVVNLPAVNGIGAPRPVIQAPNGQFALNSAANTEISNINIDNSGPGLRAGIFADAGNVNEGGGLGVVDEM